MNLRYVKNMTDQSVNMLLYSPIGRGDGIDGAAFADEMYWLSNRVPLINLRINSPGGGIFDGYSIYSAMREVNVPVDTYNDFLAGSMAGIISQQGRKRYAADNAFIMLHNPSGGGTTKKDKEILGLLKNSLIEAFTARTGKDAKVISDLMDVETWVEARKVNGVSAMIEMGLADELFSSAVKVDATPQIFNAAKLYSISNNILKNEEMDNQKIEELNKKVEELTNSVSALKKSTEDKDTEIANLKKAIEDKDKVLKEASDKAAVELVENAIKDGKIKAEKKDAMIADAKTSYGVVKNMLDSMPASTATRFTNVINSGGGQDKPEIPKDRESWTIRDWDRKDPKGLAKIKNENPELYQEMYDKQYKN
jgi:ATP-dependent Clp protease protease subunit